LLWVLFDSTTKRDSAKPSGRVKSNKKGLFIRVPSLIRGQYFYQGLVKGHRYL